MKTYAGFSHGMPTTEADTINRDLLRRLRPVELGRIPLEELIGSLVGGFERRHPEVTEAAFAKVRADKTREANDGFDGSWVAHPDLVPTCREVFDSVLGSRPNQLDKQRPEVNVTAEQLLDVSSAEGQVTESGLRLNLYVAVAYTAVWLSGKQSSAPPPP